jgi:hypothetical protein
MSSTPLPATAFMYVESDIPAGMTLDAWRRQASEKRGRRRRRVVWIPGMDRRTPLGSVLPALRTV